MAGALSALTASMPVAYRTPRPSEFQTSQPEPVPGEGPTVYPKMLVVRDIEEDETGATLRFDPEGQGRLSRRAADYTMSLRLARGSRERQHPVGIDFGEERVVTKVVRADNDVPTELSEDRPGHARVLFQGHDGVFSLRADHPEAGRIHALLDEAARHKRRVWFIARKPDLTLVDALAAGWSPATPEAGKAVPMIFTISFVVAPDHLLKIADGILRSKIRAEADTYRDIRALAKAYIDEADELKRAVRDIQAGNISQIESLSPLEMIEKAKRLQIVRLRNETIEGKVRKVAESYLLIAEQNQKLVDEFRAKLRNTIGSM